MERASASAHEAVDRIAGRAERFADRLDERSRRLTDAPLRALDYATHQVQTHPVQAVAISLAVGYVAGLLSGWRGASQRDYRD